MVKAWPRSSTLKARKVVGRQRLQREARLTATDGEPTLIAVSRNVDVGSLGQLAHDVVEHMGWHRGGAFALGPRRHRLDDLHIEVGRGQLQLVVARGERTLDRMGMVLRRSTTLATWASALVRAGLSMVNCMG